MDAINTTASDIINTIKEKVTPVMEPLQQRMRESAKFIHESQTETGTVLRAHLATARQELETKVDEVDARVNLIKQDVESSVAPVKESLDTVSHQASEFNGFRRQHPEAVLGLVATTVALPSLAFRGRWFMVKDVLVASGLTSTALFAGQKADEYFEKQQK